MKIKELNSYLAKVSELFTFTWSTVNVNNKNHIKFQGLKNFRKGIKILEQTGLLKEEIKIIKNSPIFTNIQDSINVIADEGRPLTNAIENLRNVVNILNSTLTEVSGTQKENSVSIRLPEIKDFDDLAKSAQAFHNVLTQAICNDQIKGQVKIENVENGSIWLDVCVHSASAVTLIGSLAWSAAVVYKKIQEGRLIEKHVQGLGIKNESLKEIKLKQTEALKLMIDAEAQQLYSTNFEGDNNEQIERLKHSIKLLSELIDKGAEIHPALNQPEKVVNLFPDMKNLTSIESKIKKLKE